MYPLETSVGAFIAQNDDLRGCVEDMGGCGLCIEFSRDLMDWLVARGHDAELAWMSLNGERRYESPWIAPDLKYPRLECGSPYAEHCAVRVGDTVVDLTARQYEESLPFPFIWSIQNG